MTAEFDIGLFLQPVLKGAHATQQRHIRQAERMHGVIRERWGCATPWSWREKHVRWFLKYYLRRSAAATVYYYELTAGLIRTRRESPQARYRLNLDKHCNGSGKAPCCNHPGETHLSPIRAPLALGWHTMRVNRAYSSM